MLFSATPFGIGAVALDFGFAFAHLAGQLVDAEIDRGVHVRGGMDRLKMDVFGAFQNHLTSLKELLNVKDDVSLDDFRELQVDGFEFSPGVVPDGVGELDVTCCDRDFCCFSVHSTNHSFCWFDRKYSHPTWK